MEGTKKNLLCAFEEALKPPPLPKSREKQPKTTTKSKKNKHRGKKTALSKGDEPVLKKTKGEGSNNAPSRRGRFGKLPNLNNNGADDDEENIEENSPHHHSSHHHQQQHSLLENAVNHLFLGEMVNKVFNDEVTGEPRLFSGIATAYNAKYDLYKVSYEDGDEEEVTTDELAAIWVSSSESRKQDDLEGTTRQHQQQQQQQEEAGTSTNKKLKKKRNKRRKRSHSVLEDVA